MRRLLLVAVLSTLGFVGRAHAVCDARIETCFTNVDVSGYLQTTGLVTGSTLTVSGTQGLGVAAGRFITVATTAPRAIGAFGVDSSYVLYIATAMPVGSWVKVGGQ